MNLFRSAPSRQIGETDRRIGEQVARFADDGATLQLGIGKIPDVAASELVARRHLGIWSEMISDGVLALERAGSLDLGRPIQTSFLFGSSELYEWADANPRLQMIRTEVINDPARIARNPAMVSVNMAMQIDLFAQANASFVGGVVHSGFGGQADFVSRCPSFARRARCGRRCTRGTKRQTPHPCYRSSPIRSHRFSTRRSSATKVVPRSSVDHEQAQARLIIERVADPRARDELLEAAGTLGLLRA